VANKKRRKTSALTKKALADARRYVIKAGEYNGGTSSSDFMVTGHSSGSPYSEMEELSKQVTRDAGGLPYKPIEYGSDLGETGYELEQGQGLGDLGGPELYGDRPSLLMKNPPRGSGPSRELVIGAAVGLAATALLGGLAYYVYRSAPTFGRSQSTRPQQRRRSPRAQTRSRSSTSAASANR
jgi:hypothetical protein